MTVWIDSVVNPTDKAAPARLTARGLTHQENA